MLLDYIHKYSYLNFTLYKSGTKNTYWYLWEESNGALQMRLAAFFQVISTKLNKEM